MSAVPTDGSVCVVGSCNVDLIAYVPAFPAPGQTLFGTRFEKGLGGKGANQAMAAAKLLCGAGAGVSFVGAVGADAFGDEYAAAFASAGVRAHLARDPAGTGEATGVAPILVCTDGAAAGANSIVVVPGANASLSAVHVDAPAAAATRGAAAPRLLQVGTARTVHARNRRQRPHFRLPGLFRVFPSSFLAVYLRVQRLPRAALAPSRFRRRVA